MNSTITPALTTYNGDPARKTLLISGLAEQGEREQAAPQRHAGPHCLPAGIQHSVILDLKLDYLHKSLADHMGLPRWTVRLVDLIFEGLPRSEVKQFGIDWITSTPVGADPSTLWASVAQLVIGDANTALEALDKRPLTFRVVNALEEVMAVNSVLLMMLESVIRRQPVSRREWMAAREAVRIASLMTSVATRTAEGTWDTETSTAIWSANAVAAECVLHALWGVGSGLGEWATGPDWIAGTGWKVEADHVKWAAKPGWIRWIADKPEAREAYYVRLARGFCRALAALPIQKAT